MGELVLRRIQVGVEATRGVAVAATKKLYGTLVPTRTQARRFPVEDRGSFVDRFRGNPKLIEAGFTLNHDLLFEDAPLFAACYLNGAAAGVGAAGTGYVWSIAPDINTDTLKTLTIEAGDDTIAWQGAFGTIDTSDWTLGLDDAITVAAVGFVKEWLPQQPSNPNNTQGSSSYTAPGIPSTFVGFTGSLSERAVESVMGWQSRLYLDVPGTAPGTTQLVGRFISAAFGVHNQSKRKYFGDGSATFSKLGRGRRQVHCQIVFEAIDTAQYQLFYNNTASVVRVQAIGGPIASTTYGVTSGIIPAGTPITAITTTALTAAIPGGTGISIGGVTFPVTPAGAALSATSIPVVSTTPPVAIASGTTVMAAKTVNFDFWGLWDTFTIGARDTNVTFQMDLQAVYDTTAAKEFALTVLNQNSAL
jgi:hypothetical protein